MFTGDKTRKTRNGLRKGDRIRHIETGKEYTVKSVCNLCDILIGMSQEPASASHYEKIGEEE